MPESQLSDASILRRLDSLERSNRRWKALALVGSAPAALAAFVMLGGWGQAGTPSAPADQAPASAPTERLAAQAFEVLDASGRLRARLGLSKEGQPSLELLDGAGLVQASLALGNFERPEDARIREATKGRNTRGRAIEPTDQTVTSVLRLGKREDSHAVELGAGGRLGVLRLRDEIGDERIELRVGPYTRPDLRATLRERAQSLLTEATLRLKAPNEFLAMELGVEPLSTERPSDRLRTAPGTLYEQATPYMTMYGWCEEPVFLLSNWAFDRPSLDIWEWGERKSVDHLFAVPPRKGADAEQAPRRDGPATPSAEADQ